MKIQKNVLVLFNVLLVGFIVLSFTGCLALPNSSEPNPGRRVSLGQSNSDGVTISIHFGRTASTSGNQFYFEVVTHADQFYNIDTLIVNINGNDITLSGNRPTQLRVPTFGGLQGGHQETVRFEISEHQSRQLLDATNLAISVNNQRRNIPNYFQRPTNISWGISNIKANINHWNSQSQNVD